MMFTGVFAPLPTPIDDHNQFDARRLRAALPRWLDSPLTGLVVLGTTGEAGLLTDDESDRIIGETRALVPRERPLIAGAGRESTQETVRAVRRAADQGVDAVLVRTPSYFKGQMTSEALVRHYREIAECSPIPVLLYNFTAATGVTLAPAAVALLAQHPNIVGVKESGSDIPQMSDLVTMTPPGFAVMAGSASTFLAALAVGVTGGVLALAGLLPEPCVRLFQSWRDGRVAEAQELQRRLLPIARLISTPYGVPGLKAALEILGCDVGQPRPPLTPASPEAVGILREALSAWKEEPA